MTLSEIINEMVSCFVDDGSDVHLSADDERRYRKILRQLSSIFEFYQINTYDDLKNRLRESLGNKYRNVSSHKVSEDDMANVILSLAFSYQEAGGFISSINELKKQSAYEFIKTMASNKIRFHVEKDEDCNHKKENS